MDYSELPAYPKTLGKAPPVPRLSESEQARRERRSDALHTLLLLATQLGPVFYLQWAVHQWAVPCSQAAHRPQQADFGRAVKNCDMVVNGMSKVQVERLLGPPANGVNDPALANLKTMHDQSYRHCVNPTQTELWKWQPPEGGRKGITIYFNRGLVLDKRKQGF
jgi:hypothetical protein